MRNQRSSTKTKIHQLLVKTYNQKISGTTVQKHLDKLTIANVIEKSKEKHRNNELHFYLSDYAKRQLEYYENIQPIISRREGRGRRGSSKKQAESREDDIAIVEDQIIIYLNLLLQAADGSGRLVPTFRILPPGWIDIPVSFEREYGVTIQDIIEHRDVGNGEIFRHIKFTMSMVQKCIDVLEKKYGIDIEKHRIERVNAYNTREDEVTLAGSESDDLIERIERTKTKEIGISIKHKNLGRLIGIIGCLIFIVADRIKYTWLYKRKPRPDSWEFHWHTVFFGREKTLELIQKSENTLPSLKARKDQQRLKYYIRKNIENHWRGIGRSNVDPSLIEIDVQREFDTILHEKKSVDSLIKQTDKRITRLYHERIKCDQQEKIYYDGKHNQVNDEIYREIVDGYEKYCEFARDILTNHDNKSNVLIAPLIELVYPLKLRKLRQIWEKSR